MKKIMVLGLSLSAMLMTSFLPLSLATANLPPARDLIGTWQSALSGKGYVLNGSAKTANFNMAMTSTGDVKLVIKAVNNNVASGLITFGNLKQQIIIKVAIPGVAPVTHTTNVNLPGYSAPVGVQISSSRIVFPSFSFGGVSIQMWGSYTTDLMMINEKMISSAQSIPVTMTGQFRLMKKR